MIRMKKKKIPSFSPATRGIVQKFYALEITM